MKKLLSQKNKILLYLLIVVLASCKNETKKQNSRIEETSRVDYLPYYNEANFTPHWLTPGSNEEQEFHKIPNFSLTNQLGNTVSQETFKNKIYVTDFFFTSCPGICPTMTSNMSKIQEEFINDNEVLLLSHSVTPTLDSIPVLNSYAVSKGVIPNKWHLVTGDRGEIYELGRKAYFVEESLGLEQTKDDFLHTENFVLIDKNKHIRGIYNGLNRTSINQLIIDIKTLKKEQ
ncbi:SCO family protein [Wenyingzhuangia sp. 2_MG-2023]|nr:SCO family protein [Wenyingzhuangia sp. 2_MG-2023]MDO6736425.1 SCO family protein [Wenyingzhuangia sp. 2_MG-2023]